MPTGCTETMQSQGGAGRRFHHPYPVPIYVPGFSAQLLHLEINPHPLMIPSGDAFSVITSMAHSNLPRAFSQPELSNSQALCGDNLAALLHPLGTLQSGETCRLITQLGQTSDLASTRQEIQRYRDPAAVEKELEELSAFWESYLATLQVQDT